MLMNRKMYTGDEFNKKYKNTEFYKFLNDDLIHCGLKYKIGLNVDILPFNTDDEWAIGGLYFCEKSECHRYCKYYGKK